MSWLTQRRWPRQGVQTVRGVKSMGSMGSGFQEPCRGHNCLEPRNWRWEEQDGELSQEAAAPK